MATDGVKIIDGDWAHDIYWSFMDMYDAGIPTEDIKKKIEEMGENSLDDFDYEIFITVYALALWEIGELTPDIFEKMVEALNKEACALEWKETGDEEYHARIKETNKLLKKLSQPKKAIRARKKYKKITNFHFQEGDIVAFKGSDNNYYCSYLLFIKQYRKECNYHFIPILYRNKKEPNIEDILSSKIVGSVIPSSLSPTGLQYGLNSQAVSHQKLYDFKSNLRKIGNLQIQEKYKYLLQWGGSRDWNHFSKWHEELEDNIRAFKMRVFDIADIVQ